MSTQSNNEFYHYGVLGMRWGVHKAKENDQSYKNKVKEEKKKAKDVQKKAKKWDKNVKRNYITIHNRAAERFNSQIDAFNEKWEGKYDTEEYPIAANRLFGELFSEEAIKMFGDRPA